MASSYLKRRINRLRQSILKRTRTTFLFNHKIHGRLLLDSSEPTSRALYIGYEFEPDLFAFMETIFKTDRPDVFLDIGANWGGYSLLAARSGIPQVEAFEPNRKIFGVLAANVSLNKLHTQIRTWSLAAGNENTEMDLFVDPRASDVSTLTPANMDERWDYSERQSCLVRRLDELLPLSGKNIFIKIDVEGAEDLVIKGLGTILKDNKVRLVVEILSDATDAIELLAGLGFKQTGAFGKDYCFDNFT
ncbi:MAG: FkbM family methyltransferase [Rhodobacteraceae bacterium]|nr:FkbM family methyltransferase [Paracoccaceae bacterium]